MRFLWPVGGHIKTYKDEMTGKNRKKQAKEVLFIACFHFIGDDKMGY